MQIKHWLRLALFVVGGGLLAGALIWLRPGETSGSASIVLPGAQATTSEHFGPGSWNHMREANLPAVADTSPPDGLEVGTDRHLRINRALRNVIDYYLLGGLPGSMAEHIAQLLAHLKANLPTVAYIDAERIVQAYLSYLAAHDALLARQTTPVVTLDSKLAAPDADRMAAWLSQLSRLRQNLLGVEVAKLWFADEEAESQRMLSALRSGDTSTLDAAASDSTQKGFDDLRLLRQQGANEQVQHNRMEQLFGEEAAKRFDLLAKEEQIWQNRYAQYRQVADRLKRQAGSAEVDRTRQIDALRSQTFVNDAERMRAQALDRR